MSDYGHRLEFGVFVTPASDRPDAVVALAQLADRVGLDLLTFQDHPYQPALLDTWTLLSYVAAATSRIRLAGNVLNLPLRNPAVLARSVASLDLLSGGRAELGIGAGGFRQAIEAMGGRPLTAGQAVDALAEAISIIRSLWDTNSRGGVRFDGRYYQLAGAKRGPAPAHAIGIWVGAYKPRMLRLTGRLADGWLPSLSYLEPGQLGAGNAAIDAAAEDAGRDPAAIRRMLNISGQFTATASAQLDGPPAHWAAELAELALADGVGTFILASDDPLAIERYAAEVVPAVRERVEQARAESSSGPPHRASSALGTERAGSTIAAEMAGGAAELTGDGPGVTPTPDDGRRLSLTRLWDEAARPTRPHSAAAAGSYTRAGRAASADLVRVHDMLRAELAGVRDLIVQVRAGTLTAGRARSEINQMTIRQNNWTMGAYCQSYCRIVTQHHSLEDAAVFPYLRSKDAGIGPVLDRLHDEHVLIHGVLDSVDQALVDYIAKPEDTSALQEAADQLSDALLSHLAYEERELIEPLARYGFYDLGT